MAESPKAPKGRKRSTSSPQLKRSESEEDVRYFDIENADQDLDGCVDEQWRKSARPKASDLKYVKDIPKGDLHRVLVIYTGGTIGMRQTPHGYAPPKPGFMHAVLTSLPPFHNLSYGDPREQYMSGTDAMPDFVMPPSKFDKLIVYNILEYEPLLDSCNMTNDDWKRIANDVAKYYDAYDGFVILHGTDTMAYTGSALSFLLENLAKTVKSYKDKTLSYGTYDLSHSSCDFLV